MNFLRPARPLSAIATAPLVGICLALAFAAAPIFSRVAGWSVLMFVVAAVARLTMNRRAAHLPSLPLKVVLFGLSAAGIAATYGSMIGIEPGLTILLVLVSLKVIETNGERDFQVLALLGYFLCLCALFFSQDLPLWLYVGAVFVLLTGMLVRFHCGSAGGWRRPIALSAKMLAQALPLIGLLFLFFPRTATSFRIQFGRSLLGSAGMSDRLSPGSVSSLALSEDIAFRVYFPDGFIPPLEQMYWRGAVLWRGDGLTWVAGPQLPLEPRAGQLAGPAIRQRISLQPHGGRWIFALDRPSPEFSKFEANAGGYLTRSRAIFNTFQYEVLSRPENRELAIPREQLLAALAPAAPPSQRIADLVQTWKAGGAAGRDVVERALRHFGEEKFSYSLDPGTYGERGLEDFLFQRRVGFCEHYAAAFATLMRTAGLPARVVIGYRGGELNRLGNYVIVRQSDAHAWTEVWLAGAGWLRVDPTDAIAPERIQAGLGSFMQTRRSAGEALPAGEADRFAGWREALRQAGLAWDSINYQWELRVLTFGEDEQQAFLARLGLPPGQRLNELLLVIVGTLVGLAVIALWMRRPARARRCDPVTGAWGEFCRRLAAAGLAREPWEGPIHFGERAAAHFAAHRDAILAVARLYARLRYAAAPPEPDALRRAVATLPDLRKST